MVAQEALNVALTGADAAARPFAAELFYGALRQELRLKHLQAHFLKRPGKLPPGMARLLLLAEYSLLFLDKAHHAVVQNVVGIIKRLHGQALANVANGFLRSVSREKEALTDPAWYAKTFTAADSVYYSLPEKICSLWLGAYGRESARLLMERSSRRPWLSFLLNPGHASGQLALEQLEAFGSRLAVQGKSEGKESFFVLDNKLFAYAPDSAPRELLGLSIPDCQKTGLIFPAGAGSYIVLKELGFLEMDGMVWDACAGFGGKSVNLAFSGRAVGLGSDISAKRLHGLKMIYKHFQIKPGGIARMDASSPAIGQWPGDILLDAPCSGLGVLARRPDLKRHYIMNMERLAGLLDAQQGILEGAASVIQPGRCIAYITCTLNPAENGEAVRKFLARHPELGLEREWQTPHEHPWLEGMYGALIRR